MIFNGILVHSESQIQQGHRLELHKFNYYQVMVPKRLELPSSGMRNVQPTTVLSFWPPSRATVQGYSLSTRTIHLPA